MSQIYTSFPNTSLIFPKQSTNGYVFQITTASPTTFIFEPETLPSVWFVLGFISNLYNSSHYPRGQDDKFYWPASNNQIALYYIPTDSYSISLSETVIRDTLMLNGDSDFSFTSLSIAFNISNSDAVHHFVDKWNQTLSAPTPNYAAFNEDLKQLWMANSILYSSSSISNTSGTFSGTVASVNSAAAYTGSHTFQNATFDSLALSSIGTFSNSSNLTFSGVTGLAITNQILQITSQSGSLQFSNLNITQAQLASLSSKSGQVGFSGTSNYAVGYYPAPLDATKLLPYIIPILLVTAIVGLVAIRMNIKRLQDRAGRDIQLTSVANPNTRADRFLSSFPPNSQAAHLALNSDNALPVSSEQHSSATMLLVRNFEGFDFVGIRPRVKISKMENGEQEIDFITYQECSIQSNACLKPRLFGTEHPQPPPSFDNFGASHECYFEVKILTKDKENAKIALGFATCPYPPFRLPGYDHTSIAYHSDTGNVFWNNRETGTACGPPITAGDILGIGYRIVDLPSYGNHILNQTVFYFTHNGIRIGDEFVTDGFYPDQIYPTIGTTGSCKLQLIFGPAESVFNDPTIFHVDETVLEMDHDHQTDQATNGLSATETDNLPTQLEMHSQGPQSEIVSEPTIAEDVRDVNSDVGILNNGIALEAEGPSNTLSQERNAKSDDNHSKRSTTEIPVDNLGKSTDAVDSEDLKNLEQTSDSGAAEKGQIVLKLDFE
ncbi:Rsp5p-dependent ubiquitination, sorting of cargo proteins at the multivesicular body [Boothiomyces sp. JEL0866]|nr:Rsp5p-dependent ubiquitination, sorting of cargo proteins at the multivesicular body [Boothiomyces sp. JEL0866]